MSDTKARPTKKDAHGAVAVRIAEQLMRYAGHGLGDDAEAVAGDIRDALDSAAWRGYDGYNIGKCLDEDHGWEMDEGMIGDLGVATWMVPQELEKLIAAWVEETGHVHPYKVGDNVTARWGGKDIEGTVHEIRMDGTTLIKRNTGEEGCPVVEWENVRVSDGSGSRSDVRSAAEDGTHEQRGPEGETPN